MACRSIFCAFGTVAAMLSPFLCVTACAVTELKNAGQRDGVPPHAVGFDCGMGKVSSLRKERMRAVGVIPPAGEMSPQATKGVRIADPYKAGT